MAEETLIWLVKCNKLKAVTAVLVEREALLEALLVVEITAVAVAVEERAPLELLLQEETAYLFGIMV
jgi:hypothetical protein